jgi:sialic acid synthase SpsE
VAPFLIGQRTVGPGCPTLIIAELAWSHDGSLEKAIRIAQAAAGAGANALSIHVTCLPEYIVRTYGNSETLSAGQPRADICAYLEAINLSFPQVGQLVSAARAAGLAVCLMPNDFISLQFCRSLDPEAFVLSPACFVEEEFVRALGEARRPAVLRIGGATLGEIERAIGLLRESNATQVLLLHGFQTYPTRIEETHLRALPVLRRLFDCEVGLADHLDGGDELAVVIPLLALACGAVALEKHITWDRTERGEDFESALDPEGFGRLVRYVRAAEAALGGETIPSLTGDALRYRQVVRKRVVAAVELPPGTVIQAHHLACKRADEGAWPNERPNLVGRRTRVALAKDSPVTAALLE